MKVPLGAEFRIRPDPHKVNADLKPCLGEYYFLCIKVHQTNEKGLRSLLFEEFLVSTRLCTSYMKKAEFNVDFKFTNLP
jgi:hypothetical protein